MEDGAQIVEVRGKLGATMLLAPLLQVENSSQPKSELWRSNKGVESWTVYEYIYQNNHSSTQLGIIQNNSI